MAMWHNDVAFGATVVQLCQRGIHTTSRNITNANNQSNILCDIRKKLQNILPHAHKDPG